MMVPPMGADALPSEQETWAQFERICSHDELSRSNNQQALLRELIQRVYAGATRFDAKSLADKVFRRDTSIAKVEGRNLRNKLESYYNGEGRSDPIFIHIPPRTFRPKISKTDDPLNDFGVDKCVSISHRLDVPHQPALREALRSVKEAMLHNTSNPPRAGLLSLKALIHVMRAVYGEDPRVEFEAAEYIVRDVYARNREDGNTALAKAALHTSACQWEEADTAFKQAIRPNTIWRSAESNAWHILFLAAHRRFAEAIEILSDYHGVPLLGRPSMDGDSATVHILAGDFRKADLLVEENYRYLGTRLVNLNGYLGPANALILAEEGDYESAVNQLGELALEPSFSIIGSATGGLLALFLGMGGRVKEAKELYSEMRGLRPHFHYLADADYEGHRVPAFHIALAALGLRRADDAVKWLNVSYTQDRDPLMLWIHLLPFLRPLHTHSGFRELVRKMHLKL